MSTKAYYINEEVSKAAEIVGSGSSFIVKIYDVGSVSEEEFKSFTDAESYVMTSITDSEGWKKCRKGDFDHRLADQADEADAILEDWFPGITTDDDFDDFPSFMSD